jgi:uncharacterized protein
VRFNREIAPGEIDFFAEGLRQDSALVVTGKAEYSHALGEIRLEGHLRVVIQADCDRCLEACRFPLDLEFRLSYLPAESNVGPEEAGLKDDEAMVAFYEGEGLELNEVFREQVLLGMPMQKLCRPECKGLCPTCGENWNQRECRCQPVAADDRWAALQSWKTAK